MSLPGRRRGDLGAVDGPRLVRLLRRGRARRRVEAARALAERGEPQALAALRDFLEDPTPGVRRAVARGLGHGGRPEDSVRLGSALTSELCTTVAIDLAAAWVRCGASPERVRPLLRGRVESRLHTARGQREPDSAAGLGARMAMREWSLVLDPERPSDGEVWSSESRVEDRRVLLTRLRSVLDEDPDSAAGRQLVEALGAQGHPADLPRLQQLRRDGGRRTDHAALSALGRLGDPRALPDLLIALVEMDVDPGRALAHRRLSAVALGRLGIPSVAPKLHQALRREAREHEGRPGAGLGIQYPVRTNLLWALGELQSARSVRVLLPYLSDLSGSALGGFYLPAMGALVKLGGGALAPVLALAEGPVGDAADNAVGVLGGLARTSPAARAALVGLGHRHDRTGTMARRVLDL